MLGRRLQGRHRRLARDAGREADRAAAHRRRRGLLPRPARPRVRRDDLGRARARGLRLRRDRHRPHLDRLRRARAPRRTSSSTSATRPAGTRRGQGLEAVTRSGQGRAGRARRTGARTSSRNFDALAELSLDLRRRATSGARAVRAALPERARDRLLRGAARRPRPRRGRDRDAGADPLRAREAGARGRQARLRREAAGDARRRDGGARRDSPRSAASC